MAQSSGFNYSLSSMAGDLAYDLRSYYAKIVGEHLIDVAFARKSLTFPDYLSALDNLYVVVKHKLKEGKKAKKKKKEGEETKDEVEETYDDLRKKAVDVINKNDGVYKGVAQDDAGYAEIDNALRSMEMYLYKKIDEANMFGAKRETEGLI